MCNPKLTRLQANHRLISACLGEAIDEIAHGGEWARGQVAPLNELLDDLEAAMVVEQARERVTHRG